MRVFEDIQNRIHLSVESQPSIAFYTFFNTSETFFSLLFPFPFHLD